MKKINLQNIIPVFIILIGTIIVSRQLFLKGFFPMHDDMQVERLYEMSLCFNDNQFPCRWVPDMGYGYGYPLFNFYPPFPYYLGQLFHLFGLSYIDSVKTLFIFGFFISGVLIYLLSEKLWGRWGATLSSVLYLFAPYHSVDVYVRGAMNEFWALAFLPGVYWAAYEIVENKEKKKPLLLFSFFFALLLLSHNLMSLIFTPTIAVFALLLIWLKKENLKSKLISFITAGFLGFGLASFFTLPVLLEKKYVHVETMLMGYFNYLAHYVSVGQLLFTRFWGYGSSSWLQTEGMPFQVGFPHWPLAVMTFLIFVGLFLYRKISKDKMVIVGFFFVIFLFSLFLIHPRSVFVWNSLPFLAYLQFPWRFLTLVIFSVSVLGGGLVSLVKDKTKMKLLTLFLITATMILNSSFFKPAKIIDITDSEKLFSAGGWNKLQTDAIFDYLPKSAEAPPAGPAPQQPEILEGLIEVSGNSKGTNWYRFQVKGEGGVVQIPVYFFPGWKVFVDEKQTDFTYDNSLGLITVGVPEGEHLITAKLTNTPVRTVANSISVLAWAVFLILFAKAFL